MVCRLGIFSSLSSGAFALEKFSVVAAASLPSPFACGPFALGCRPLVALRFSPGRGDRFSSSSLLNRDRIGLSLQSEISDRILINGKIGVPVSGTEENVILGNVQIEFLLNV